MGAAPEERRLPWRVAAALAVTQIVHWGSLFYAFSALMPAMSAETGWTREAVVGAFSAGLLAEAAAAIVVGALLDRLGSRVVMTAGSIVAGLGLWSAGQVEALWQLYAVWIGLGAVMAATLYQAAFAAVTAAFGSGGARRGIALVVFIGGFASTVFWPLTGYLVQELGWREACAVLAVANALCALPHAILLPGAPQPKRPSPDAASSAPLANRAGPQDATPEPGLPEACRQGRFWGLALVYAVVGLGGSAIAVHLVPLLHERGAGASATALASLVGVAQVAGRTLEFAGGGRWSLRAVGGTALAALPLAFLGLALGAEVVVLAGAVALYGASNGAMTVVRGALPSRIFGTAHYGAIAGALAACGALARAAGPIAVAWLWERGGGYGPPMVGLALLCVVGVVAFAVATRRC